MADIGSSDVEGYRPDFRPCSRGNCTFVVGIAVGDRFKTKEGPARALFVVAAVVRGIGWEEDQAAVDRERLELDREPGSFLVRVRNNWWVDPDLRQRS
jgi:hypothetical protein